jgi:hypothetical protein
VTSAAFADLGSVALRRPAPGGGRGLRVHVRSIVLLRRSHDSDATGPLPPMARSVRTGRLRADYVSIHLARIFPLPRSAGDRPDRPRLPHDVEPDPRIAAQMTAALSGMAAP